jgi:large subunit ribosomal protein L21
MFAVVETGGKQYKVEPESVIRVEKLEGEKGDEITMENILAVESKGEMKVGNPYVKNARVKAEIVNQGKGKKIVVFKYKPKKRIRVKTGHRQHYTTLRVKEIIAG